MERPHEHRDEPPAGWSWDGDEIVGGDVRIFRGPPGDVCFRVGDEQFRLSGAVLTFRGSCLCTPWDGGPETVTERSMER